MHTYHPRIKEVWSSASFDTQYVPVGTNILTYGIFPPRIKGLAQLQLLPRRSSVSTTSRRPGLIRRCVQELPVCSNETLVLYTERQERAVRYHPSHSESRRSMELEWALSGDSDEEREVLRTPPSIRYNRFRDPIFGWAGHTRLGNLKACPRTHTLDQLQATIGREKHCRSCRSPSPEKCPRPRAPRPIKVADIIGKYLRHLLKYTKGRVAEFHGLRDDRGVEFVLHVPISWS